MTILSTLLLLGIQAPAQVLASASTETTLPGDRTVADEALILHAPGAPAARTWLGAQAWHALLGDRDLDGRFDLPEGVDALAALPAPNGLPTSPQDLLFSTDRDGFGYRDGDLLQLSAVGTVLVIRAEADLLAALQPTAGGLDVDAVALRPDGTLLLSLKDPLSGTILGDLEDGDVFAWDPATGALALLADEAQVQAWVTHATGSNAAIGDVKSLAWDAARNELLFTVQSPTDRDATVFGDDAGGRVVPGLEEIGWGFLHGGELDALAVPDSRIGTPMQLTTAKTEYAVGESLGLALSHGSPGESAIGYLTAASTWQRVPLGGFGLQLVDPLGGPRLLWPRPGDPPIGIGPDGHGGTAFAVPALPAGVSELELLAQAAGGVSGLSSPVRIVVR